MTTCMSPCPWCARTAPRRPSGGTWCGLSELCADAECRLGLTVVDGRSAGRPARYGPGRDGGVSAGGSRPEPERMSLARLVRGAAVASAGEAEFVRRLRGAGVIRAPRYKEGGTAQVVGYSVALAPASGEGPVWFGGGRLARDLALPALRAGLVRLGGEPGDEVLAEWGGHRAARWARARSTGARRGRVGQRGGPGRPGRRALGRSAGGGAGTVGRGSPGDGRGLRGVVGAGGGGRSRCSGPGGRRTLGWSAQERELTGTARWREPAARDFRGVASVVTQSAIGPGSAMGWVLLMRSMMRTVEEIGQAHQARGEALQAARLARLVTVELAQLEARLHREAALVGAREAASEAQPERASRARHHRRPARCVLPAAAA